MKIKPESLVIPPAEPFEYDALQREKCANVLTDFVSSLEQSFVLAIDSPWGTGKTTFVNMWQAHWKNQGGHSLYFNAWKSDFNESPLVALIGEIGEGLNDLKMGHPAKTAALAIFKKTVVTGSALVKAAIPALIKIGTGGMIDTKEVAEELGKAAKEYAQKQIEHYDADKRTIERFRSELAELVGIVQQDGIDKAKPVIFFIDELDRCRPPYAVALLERVKHLFDVTGLVFVLSVDRKQLSHSIKALYGSEFDSRDYLRRFIDLEYRLPAPDCEQFVASQFERMGLHKALKTKLGHAGHDAGRLVESFAELFALFEFPLRIQEQCLTKLVVVIRTTPKHAPLCSHLLTLLICLREADPMLYHQYCDGKVDVNTVMEHLYSLPRGPVFRISKLRYHIEAILIFGLPHKRMRLAREDYEIRAKSNNDGGHARQVVDALEELAPLLRDVDNLSKYVREKIELTERFVAVDDPEK